MKRLVKSLSVFVLLFVLAFVVVANVKADEEPVLTVAPGASMRTWGDAQGLRFIAELDSLTDVTERGFYVAKGELSVDETVALNKKFPVSVGEEEYNKFSAVIYNIPEASYTQDITVVAYYVVNDVEKFADAAVTRNIAEVAFAAKNAGSQADLVGEIVDSIEGNYKLLSYENEKYVLTSSLYANNSQLEEVFVNDVNDVLGLSLTTDMTADDFFLAITEMPAEKLGTTSKSLDDISSLPLFKFFKNEVMNAKWSSLVDYIKTVGSGNPHVVNQSKALLNAVEFSGNRTEDTTTYPYTFHYLEHFTYSLYNYFNEANEYDYYAPIYWDLKGTTFEANPYENNTVYVNLLNYKLVKTEDVITLENLEKEGYTFNGWTDGTETYNDSYVVTADDVTLEPSFTVISYSIEYYNGTELVKEAEYTVEDNYVLEALDNKPGLTFNGWYDNEELAGEVVTEIEKGTTGDKVYYASWTEGYSLIVVNSEWAGLADGETVKVDEVEYTIGSDAHVSILAAFEYIQENGTINVLAGTYEDNITIEKGNVTLLGAAADVAGNGERPVAEAVITGVITLAAGVDNVTINGFKFTGASQVIGTANPNSGTASATLVNHDNFTFINNVVEVELTSSNKGFIELYGGTHSYETNTVITNNLFDGTNSTAVNMIYVDNVEEFSLTENVFRNISGNAFYENDTNKGLCGQYAYFTGNIFDGVTGTAIYANWIVPGDAYQGIAEYYFDENTFNNVYIGININKCNNVDKFKLLSISNNTFTGEITTAVKVGRIVSGSTYKVEGNVFETVPTTAYFDGTNSAGSGYGGSINVVNNIYKEEGIEINPDSSKFIGDIKCEYIVTYDLSNYINLVIDSRDTLVTVMLTDFYNWLVEKGHVNAEEITLDAFLTEDWMNYIGCELAASGLPVSEYKLFRPVNGNSNTINEDYFATSSVYINLWGKLLDVVNVNWNKSNKRIWTSYGMLDFGRWIKNAGGSSFYTVTQAYNAFITNPVFEMALASKDAKLGDAPALEGYVASWNTKDDGTGETIENGYYDSTLYVVYTAVAEDKE